MKKLVLNVTALAVIAMGAAHLLTPSPAEARPNVCCSGGGVTCCGEGCSVGPGGCSAW